mmetsp:Transcript_67743/g.151227  ORF Transcript_67743/g.151227 Transcript_67743/m.151227 type:complete len:214 (-) Transcript_67743:832-1473(-)
MTPQKPTHATPRHKKRSHKPEPAHSQLLTRQSQACAAARNAVALAPCVYRRVTGVASCVHNRREAGYLSTPRHTEMGCAVMSAGSPLQHTSPKAARPLVKAATKRPAHRRWHRARAVHIPLPWWSSAARTDTSLDTEGRAVECSRAPHPKPPQGKCAQHRTRCQRAAQHLTRFRRTTRWFCAWAPNSSRQGLIGRHASTNCQGATYPAHAPRG